MTAPDYFVPQQMPIRTIFKGSPTRIVTNSNHNYRDGLVVRIVIPLAEQANGQPPTALNSSRGMSQLNDFVGPITVVGTAAFSIPIDSTTFDDFSITLDPKDYEYVGQVIPVAENALTLTSATKNNYTSIPQLYGTPPAPQTI